MNILKWFMTIMMSTTSLMVLFVFAWSIIFYSYFSASIALLGGLIFLPFRLEQKRFWIIRIVVFVTGLILLFSTVHLTIGEINNRIGVLANTPRNKNSISLFTTRDKLGIYGLNLMMAVFAYPLYPEISKETLMMVLPSPKDGVRSFDSEFAIKSEKVRHVIKKFNQELRNEKGKKEVRFQKRIYWKASNYSLGKKEARYALALNPSIMTLIASKQNSSWIIDVSLKVKCAYPRNSDITLLSNPELKIEEGLFWVLQQAGWLHPYIANWKFRINSEDVRINH